MGEPQAPPIFMAKKANPVEEAVGMPVEAIEKPVEAVSAFTPVIVQDMSSRIVRARRVNSQEELDMYVSRGWVNRG